jgi:hypothetical protein
MMLVEEDAHKRSPRSGRTKELEVPGDASKFVGVLEMMTRFGSSIFACLRRTYIYRVRGYTSTSERWRSYSTSDFTVGGRRSRPDIF